MNEILAEITALLGKLSSGELLANPLGIFSALSFPLALVFAAALALVAIFGYRVFKTVISVATCVVCGIVGTTVVAPVVLNMVALPNIAGISIPAVIGLVFAAIGLLIGLKCYKLALFLICAGGVFLVGQPILAGILTPMALPFISTELGVMVVSLVAGVLVGVLMLLVFKPVFIVVTSLGCCAAATAFVVGSVAPGISIAPIAGLALGAIIGIFAAKGQFAYDKK